MNEEPAGERLATRPRGGSDAGVRAVFAYPAVVASPGEAHTGEAYCGADGGREPGPVASAQDFGTGAVRMHRSVKQETS